MPKREKDVLVFFTRMPSFDEHQGTLRLDKIIELDTFFFELYDGGKVQRDEH